MAETGLAFTFLLALALGDAEDQQELISYARAADVDPDALMTELVAEPDVYELVEDGSISDELYPLSSRAAKHFRSTSRFGELMTELGSDQMKEVGNLYTASLPAWMAAGIEQAVNDDTDLTDASILTIGYGSGDAAEIIPMRFVAGWQDAASKIRFSDTMADAHDLAEGDYAALHDSEMESLVTETSGVFHIERVGQGDMPYDDRGIEYYTLG